MPDLLRERASNADADEQQHGNGAVPCLRQHRDSVGARNHSLAAIQPTRDHRTGGGGVMMRLIGEETDYGKIVAVLWIGERYYFCLKDGVVSLIPADVIEVGAG